MQPLALAGLVAYLLLLIYTVIRILLDTPSTSKTLAYLLLVLILPLVGMLVYFSFGTNYRHRKSLSRMMRCQREFDLEYLKAEQDHTEVLLQKIGPEVGQFDELVRFLHGLGSEYLWMGRPTLLINGEEKFPSVLKALEQSTSFIHLEYYDWENDHRGNQIKEKLIEKAKQGVTVRVLYDDFASHGIKNNIIPELEAHGIKAYPKVKLKLYMLANRLNHRDHRKLIIVDGRVGFVGGINISDRYDNGYDTGLYWRDTHAKLEGEVVSAMQRHFIVSWNSSQDDQLSYSEELFPQSDEEIIGDVPVQMVAGGPLYPYQNMMLTYLKIFSIASEKLYITNPYFIPNESIMNALKQAAISGVDVRLMVPEKSDSAVVGLASSFYFEPLLKAGVKVYLYQKGFVHAKTLVADGVVSVVGTANMDIRSFDLNFEIMSVLYSGEFASLLEDQFLKDLEDCRVLELEEWQTRGMGKRLLEATARLSSSFL